MGPYFHCSFILSSIHPSIYLYSYSSYLHSYLGLKFPFTHPDNLTQAYFAIHLYILLPQFIYFSICLFICHAHLAIHSIHPPIHQSMHSIPYAPIPLLAYFTHQSLSSHPFTYPPILLVIHFSSHLHLHYSLTHPFLLCLLIYIVMHLCSHSSAYLPIYPSPTTNPTFCLSTHSFFIHLSTHSSLYFSIHISIYPPT